MKRDQSNTILSILLFSIAIMLSGNVFAADTTPRRVTQPEFDAAITNQAAIDATQQTALDKALDDIAKLQAAISKLSIRKVGDHFGGGVVFYVDPNGQHGLIASLSDQGTPWWYNGEFKVTGATGDGVGAGATNTAIIVAAQSNDTPGGNFAAKAAADFSVQEDGLTACSGLVDEVCYGDWYLPSKHELNLLIQRQDVLPNLVLNSEQYWSSTERDFANAWARFFNGIEGTGDKDSWGHVRAIRAF